MATSFSKTTSITVFTDDAAMKIWLKSDEQKTKYKYEQSSWKTKGSRVLREKEKNSQTTIEAIFVVHALII
jgi:frataxin-like iron-binding protein CyaY